MPAQILVLESDSEPAAKLFGARLPVMLASAVNGEVIDSEVFVCGDAAFTEQFCAQTKGAAILWQVPEVPDWSSFPDYKAGGKWIRANQIPYNPDSAPAGSTNEATSSPASSPAGRGPDNDLTAQVSQEAARSAVSAEGPALSEPAGRDLTSYPQEDGSEWPEGASKRKPARVRNQRPRLASVDGNAALQPDPDADPLPAALSEDAIADHFVGNYGADWRYVPEWSMWLQWRGDGWHRDTRNEVSSLCMRITREALQWPEAAGLTADGKRKINSKRTAWNARDVAATDPRISILAEVLDADPMLLGVPGGVVDLKTGKLLDADPEQYITRRCSIAPADGVHPLFDRVLARACAEHDGMREYLLRWFGYMLTGSVQEEAFVFLHGPGGSGKSTLVKCLTEILGDYALTIAMDAFTESKNDRHSQEIAKLEGARLVYASETEEGRRFKESQIQLLTGGDKIVAHRMRMDDREYRPTFKILVYGNSVPHLKNVSEAMRRRIHLIKYGESLTDDEKDRTLKERLVLEYPAILATLIRGCVDWQDCGGLGKPESVSASVDEYMQAEDSFAVFIDECLERDQAGRERSADVYRRYRTWADAAGEFVMSQKRFVQVMRSKGFDTVRTATARQMSGLKLRSAPVQDERPHWQQD